MSHSAARGPGLLEQEKPLCVLLAVSDPTLLRMLARFLRRDSHDVTEARDGAELLGAMEKPPLGLTYPFDVIICHDYPLGFAENVRPARTAPPSYYDPVRPLTEDPEMQDRAQDPGAITLLSPSGVRLFGSAGPACGEASDFERQGQRS